MFVSSILGISIASFGQITHFKKGKPTYGSSSDRGRMSYFMNGSGSDLVRIRCFINGSGSDRGRMSYFINGSGSVILICSGSAAVCKWTPLRTRFADPFRIFWYLRGGSAPESFCYLGTVSKTQQFIACNVCVYVCILFCVI